MLRNGVATSCIETRINLRGDRDGETPDPRRDQFSQRASLSFFYMVRAGFRRIFGRQYSNSPDTVLYVTVVRTAVLL